MRLTIRAPRRSNLGCRLILAVLFALAGGRAVDLRGVWMAENHADAGLERAHVIVDPPGGKIPYRPEALARQKKISLTARRPIRKRNAFSPACRARLTFARLFRSFQNDRAVYIVYQDVHAYRTFI